MILILSNETDNTTVTVLKWLRFFKEDFIRVNGEDLVENFEAELNNAQQTNLFYQNFNIDFEKVKSFWYRRGKVDLSKNVKDKIQDDETVEAVFQKNLKNEIKILEDYFHHSLKEKKSIGHYDLRGVNKLKTLNAARTVGLKIPATLVTKEKQKLKSFFEKHKELITKAIYEVPIDRIYNNGLYAYTSVVDKTLLEKLPDHFFPSLFQEKVKKKYELRIFYLNKKCYGTAIFSQLDKQTSVDFRNYNFERPNRRIPFNLPEVVEKKIVKLMEKVGLNCGSIDMILTPENEFVFLEVNPVGQFGYTSKVGNFRLEKEIALFLSNKNDANISTQK